MRIVVFNPTGARIINTDDPIPFVGQDDTVINADLTQVRGIPPHYWKLVDDTIQPMSKEEREIRDQQLQLIQPPSVPSRLQVITSKPEVKIIKLPVGTSNRNLGPIIINFIAGLVLGLILVKIGIL